MYFFSWKFRKQNFLFPYKSYFARTFFVSCLLLRRCHRRPSFRLLVCFEFPRAYAGSYARQWIGTILIVKSIRLFHSIWLADSAGSKGDTGNEIESEKNVETIKELQPANGTARESGILTIFTCVNTCSRQFHTPLTRPF